VKALIPNRPAFRTANTMMTTIVGYDRSASVTESAAPLRANRRSDALD
jgi:hypothetical protein